MNQTRLNIMQRWPYLLGLILGLYFITLNVTGIDFAYFPGDLGDGRFNIYILEHAHQYFSGNLESFWSAPFMYPEKEIITFSDNLLGTAPIYSIFRVFGADIFTAFQFWFVVMVILNYSSCYLFLNWLLKNKYAAVLGAFVFAFSMGLQSQMAHAQTFPRFFIPLTIWMLLLFMAELKPKHFFFALFFGVMQFYSGIYLGFMLSIPLVFILLVLTIKKRKELIQQFKQWKWLLQILVAFFVNLVLLIVLMLPYYERSVQVGESVFEQDLHTIPLFKSFIFAPQGSPIWGFLNSVGTELQAPWNHQLFPGGIAVLSLLTFFLLMTFRKKLNIKQLHSNNITILALTALLTFVFVIRVNELTLYRLFYSIPGFSSIRSITRIINIDVLFFGLALAVIALLILNRFVKYKVPIFILMLALLTFDNYFIEGSSYRYEKKIAQQRLKSLKEKMKDIPIGGIVSYEPVKREDAVYCYQIDAMLAAQSLGLKTVNGYSGNSPVAYQSFWYEMNEDARITWFESLNFKPDTVYVIP
jgi:hypothetical protein